MFSPHWFHISFNQIESDNFDFFARVSGMFSGTKWIILLSMHSLKFSDDSVWLICSFVIKSNKLTFLSTQAERTRIKHVLDGICYFVGFCWWTHWTRKDEICNVISLTYYPQSKLCCYLSCPDFLAPAKGGKAWVMVTYITCIGVITARKNEFFSASRLFPLRNLKIATTVCRCFQCI